MTFYALVRLHIDSVHTQAANRKEALSSFAGLIGKELVDEPTGRVNEYLLDEWEDSPHAINATIPIWIKQNQ